MGVHFYRHNEIKPSGIWRQKSVSTFERYKKCVSWGGEGGFENEEISVVSEGIGHLIKDNGTLIVASGLQDFSDSKDKIKDIDYLDWNDMWWW